MPQWHTHSALRDKFYTSPSITSIGAKTRPMGLHGLGCSSILINSFYCESFCFLDVGVVDPFGSFLWFHKNIELAQDFDKFTKIHYILCKLYRLKQASGTVMPIWCHHKGKILGGIILKSWKGTAAITLCQESRVGCAYFPRGFRLGVRFPEVPTDAPGPDS